MIFSKKLLLTPAGEKIKKVAVSGYTTWYITENGDLYGTGYNEHGQQGSGNTSNVSAFTKRASSVKDVACGDYSNWYLTENGDLYGCGWNHNGQQGSGNTTDVLTFTKRASNVKKVSCGGSVYYMAWYLTENGDLYGCGDGNFGGQGSGNTNDVLTFTKRASNVKDFFSNATTTWYITNTGDLYGTGYGGSGQQGNGSTSNVLTFTKRASNVKKVISYGGDTTWYITNTGDLYGCGSNSYGIQGSGTSGSATKVLTFTKRASNVKDVVSFNQYATWYITEDGDLYGCGRNNLGQQGNGTSGDTNVTTFTKRASGVKKAVGSSSSTFFINEDGDLYGCGDGKLCGSGSTEAVTTFTKIASNVKDVACSHRSTWYINEKSQLYASGTTYYGSMGELGSSLVFVKRS